jgi:phthiocerol/phenolphthiocerol synthesis type-I polyketide synthase E
MTDDTAVAVVGLTVRFPGSQDLDSLWANLLAARDCVTRGQPEAGATANPGDVAAYGAIADPTAFDRTRFDMSAAEALLVDPQQRLLLETAGQALAVANVDHGREREISVFLGAGRNGYESLLRAQLHGRPGVDETSLELGNARDYCAARVSYRLGFQGASVNVQAACSTALVAVHLACQNLLAYESDVALAGAASVRVPRQWGYQALPGGIGSPDGVCRPFDRRANGTVPGDGVGVVVLRRLGDALAAGDTVWAVIRGSAVNNDGRKSGFGSVSAAAQAKVIREALAVAEVPPRAIAYLEAHGTGTPLGDAVEWSALAQVFGDRDTPLYVGSVKGNLGHLREAAGMAGLAKAILMLRHRTLVPTANFDELPLDGRAGHPLRPLDAVVDWSAGASPRRAGVSAFGLGGTNAHLVLEEWADHAPVTPDRGGLVLWSSHLEQTLARDTAALRDRLAQDRDATGDVAFTSQTARARYRYRRFALVRADTVLDDAFASGDLAAATRDAPGPPPAIAFAFPGVGSEYAGMGAGLREESGLFGGHLDALLARARDLVGHDLAPVFQRAADGGNRQRLDLRGLLHPPPDARRDPCLARAPVSHLSLFCFEVALARTLIDLDVRPAALLGHSVGELVAATVAGVLPLDAALGVVAERAALVEAAGEGAMAAVATDEATLGQFLGPGSWLAADNSPRHCVVSGRPAAVADVLARLDAAGHTTRALTTTHPFHTPQLAAAGRRLEELMATVPRRPAAVPVVSSVTGEWADGELADPGYWRRQLVQPVRFRSGLRSLLRRHRLVLEVGPGAIRPWSLQVDPGASCLRTVRHAYEHVPDLELLLEALGHLWLHGAEPTWPRLHDGARRRRVTLPAPALERRPYEPGAEVHDPAPQPPPPVERAAGPGILQARLGELWTALLGLTEVGPDDDFFRLGGDSLMGTHLLRLIRDLTGRDVPAGVVFEHSTLAGMTRAVGTWTAGGPEAER